MGFLSKIWKGITGAIGDVVSWLTGIEEPDINDHQQGVLVNRMLLNCLLFMAKERLGEFAYSLPPAGRATNTCILFLPYVKVKLKRSEMFT